MEVPRCEDKDQQSTEFVSMMLQEELDQLKLLEEDEVEDDGLEEDEIEVLEVDESEEDDKVEGDNVNKVEEDDANKEQNEERKEQDAITQVSEKDLPGLELVVALEKDLPRLEPVVLEERNKERNEELVVVDKAENKIDKPDGEQLDKEQEEVEGDKEADENTIDHRKKPRTSTRIKFPANILIMTTGVRKKHKDLMRQQRKTLETMIMKQFIACCVDKIALADAEDKMAYLENNKELANRVLCLLKSVKNQLTKKLKVSFSALDLTSTYAAIDKRDKVEEFVLEDKLEYVEKNVDDLQYVLNVFDKCSNKTADKLLTLTKKHFGDAAAKLPTVCIAKKSLPEIQQYVVSACEKDQERN